jgi:Asp-tRNA(Asn)/Glu-tRNA(Gln) amidotransferase A subunit family amidase
MELQYALNCLKDVGAEFVQVDLAIPQRTPDIHDALTHHEGFEETYKAAHTEVQEIEWEFTKTFRQCDMILAPVSAKVAPHAEKGAAPDQPWLRENFALSAVELTGLPALVVPCGFAHAMPVSFQLIAPKWHENNLLRMAYAYECLVGPPSAARMRDVDPFSMESPGS